MEQSFSKGQSEEDNGKRFIPLAPLHSYILSHSKKCYFIFLPKPLLSRRGHGKQGEEERKSELKCITGLM